jgi:hypothetical protein
MTEYRDLHLVAACRLTAPAGTLSPQLQAGSADGGRCGEEKRKEYMMLLGLGIGEIGGARGGDMGWGRGIRMVGDLMLFGISSLTNMAVVYQWLAKDVPAPDQWERGVWEAEGYRKLGLGESSGMTAWVSELTA